MAPAIIIATSSRSLPISCCIFSHPIPPSSTLRKICGTRYGKKSSRTTLSNPSTTSTPSLRRLHFTSNVIRPSSNPSRPSPTSSGHFDVELVSDSIKRQRPVSLSGEPRQRVHDGRRNDRGGGFANTERGVVAWHDMHIDRRWRIGHVRRAKIV